MPPYMTAPMFHGTNSFSPKSRISLLVFFSAAPHSSSGATLTLNRLFPETEWAQVFV
jgi:hypothetical protein